MPKFIAKSLLIFIASASSLAGPADSGTDQLRYLEESRSIAKEFMQALGGTLKKQLEAGGAESAISILQAYRAGDGSRILERRPRGQACIPEKPQSINRFAG